MAQKQRKKRSWLRTALWFLLFPLVVWFSALLIWFYWYDLTRLLGKVEEKAKPAGKIDSQQERRENSAAKPPSRAPEKILEEDRKKLEDILKQRP
jgi:hypothetical protein